MTTYDTSPERQAFEVWMQERFPSAPLYRRDAKGSLRFGQYCSSAVEDQWETWKARGALAAPSASIADTAGAISNAKFALEKCGPYKCQAAQQDGVLCADDSCDIATGVRTAAVVLDDERAALARVIILLREVHDGYGSLHERSKACKEALDTLNRIKKPIDARAASPQAVAQPVRALLAAGAPSVADAAGASESEESLVRYCPGCGSIGAVGAQYRDCCPDGSDARMVPQKFAQQCRDTFKLAIAAIAKESAK